MTSTAIVTSCNNIAFIDTAIRSCINQTPHFDQIIVVDDCSTDASFPTLTRLQKDLNFILLKTAKNMGPSGARNLGIKQAIGQYINFLDGDDYLLPGKLQEQISILEASPNSAVCYSDCSILRGNNFLDFTFNDFAPATSGYILPHLFQRNCIALHTALVRTSIARQVMFDESLRSAEDYDFWLRVAQLNDSFIYIDKVMAVYRRGQVSLTTARLGSITNNIQVLDKIRGVDDAARAVISQQKAYLLHERFRLLVKNSSKEAFDSLAEAATLVPLPRRLWLISSVNKISQTLGRKVALALLKGATSVENRAIADTI